MPSPAPVHDTLPLADSVSRDYLRHHRVCPRGLTEAGALRLAATADAFLDAALDDLATAYGRAVVVESVSAEELERLIERLTAAEDRLADLDAVVDGADPSLDEATGALATADTRQLAAQPPVVRYVSLLLREAYAAGASDIHLEATRSGLTARFRLDGVLTVAPEPPSAFASAIVSRVKLLADLDIAERRRPQDGRIRVRLDVGELDLRVSTVPTLFGESVVMRLLDRGSRPITLEELGMPRGVLTGIQGLAARPHGLILVTGPTGSGKTTTLYAALQCRDAKGEKIITVEDPVEYQLRGITQVPVHRQHGVTFATALRSILRQDPDVVMIGEMRDEETADVAVQAAMTGHVVLSTLHTNDAVSAIPRLADLAVPAYLIAATLEGVLAQRLVRRVCDSCRVSYQPTDEALAAMTQAIAARGDDGADGRRTVAPSSGPALAVVSNDPTHSAHGGTVGKRPASLVTGERLTTPTYSRGAGCPACRGTGFRGRVGLFELLAIDDSMRDAITHDATRTELRTIARARGMRPLVLDGWEKVSQGATTIEEVLRVVQV